MLVIPAIDIKDGKVVFLLQGKYTEPKVYSHNPVEAAKEWEQEGASRLHIVDLDGAQAGEPHNIAALKNIIENVNIPVQFGGGLRKRDDIKDVLDIGVRWAILGTKACEDLMFIKEIVAEFGEQIIISIDVKYTKVAVHGWTRTTELEDVELIRKMQEIGIKSFVYTDISRDGTLTGANIEAVRRVLQETRASIFYAGGVTSLEDVHNLKELKAQGLSGIIIGKAFYENKISLLPIQKILDRDV